jgi:VanZ family protein
LNTLKSPSKKRVSFAARWLGGWLPLWLCTGLVFKGSLLAPSEIPHFFNRFNDKLVHGVEFFLLYLSAVHAFRLAQSALFRHAGVVAFAYSIFIGILTEVAQRYVKGRSPDVYDLLADTLGAAVGLLVYGLFRYGSYTRYKRVQE